MAVAPQPFKLGLTGSIGMGKSTVAGFFAEQGIPIFSADQVVHDLYAPAGAAVPIIEAEFPGVVVDGAVDRTRLSAAVMGKPDALKKLESIIHPLVADARQQFIHKYGSEGQPLVVLEVPLLFETGLQTDMDAVLVVSAPEDVQRTRVLARPGMTPEKLQAILARQVPDAVKQEQADFVIDTGTSLADTKEQVLKLVATIAARRQDGDATATLTATEDG